MLRRDNRRHFDVFARHVLVGGMIGVVAGPGAAWAVPDEKVERGPITVTPGTQDGKKGYFVEYDEYTYESIQDALRKLDPQLSEAERAALAAELVKSGRSVSEKEMKALLESYKSVKAGYDKEYGRDSVSPDQLMASAVKVQSGALKVKDLEAGIKEMRELLKWNALTGLPPGRTDLWSRNFPAKPMHIAAIDSVLGKPRWSGAYGDKKTWLSAYLGLKKDGTVKNYGGIPNTGSSLVEAGRLARIIQLMDQGILPPAKTTAVSGEHMAFYVRRPFSVPFTRDALVKKLKEVFKLGVDTYSPIALDLNHDGKIGVTGRSTAAVRAPGNEFVAAGSVMFDLRAAGKTERYEWLDGSGDGFLVWDQGGSVTRAAAATGAIDGTRLFGNVVGYDHGYQKLALLTGGVQVAARDLPALPESVMQRKEIAGEAMRDLRIWVDRNHDALVQPDELALPGALGITAIGMQPKFEQNEFGETVIRGYFVQDGQTRMTEDVWFAAEPKAGR